MTDQIDPRARDEILTRLRRVEGQIRGIQKMIVEERSCESVVTQLMAGRAALDRVGMLVMSQHIEHCLLDPDGSSNRAHLERIISFFLKFAGPPPADVPLDDTAADSGVADDADADDEGYGA